MNTKVKLKNVLNYIIESHEQKYKIIIQSIDVHSTLRVDTDNFIIC